MICSWQLHNIAVRNVGNVYKKDICYCPELPDNLNHYMFHRYSSSFLPWGLQIRFSSQLYYENLIYILHPSKGVKKVDFFCPSHQSERQEFAWYTLRVTTWKQKKLLCELFLWPPLKQGHFASIWDKSIMIYFLMWGWCSLIDTNTAGRRLGLHWNQRFIDFCGWTPMEK